MRKPIKTLIARQIMKENPNMLPEAVLAEMKKRKAPSTRGSINTIRSWMRSEGIKLPNWNKISGKRPGPGRQVHLGTRTEAIMKYIYNNPRASSKEIKTYLKKEKKGDVSLSLVKTIKTKMEKWFKDIDFSVKPEPIKLTVAQEKMIPEFERLIGWALYKEIFPKLKWPTEAKRECEEFVQGKILQLIKNYKKTKTTLSTYVLGRARFLVKDFVRKNLVEGMGITQTKVRLLINIIREKAQGLENNKKIAKKLGCSETEVRELWKAYQIFRRTKARLGQQMQEQ